MKINSSKIAVISLLIILLSSCIDDSFDIPTPSGTEENEALTIVLDNIANDPTWNVISISELKSRYTPGLTPRMSPVLINKNDVLKGYVVSSDRSNNFFEEIYIQDAPENPTSGIKIAISLRNSNTKFNIGRAVYIHLNGLYLGETRNTNFSNDGVLTIGGKVDFNNPLQVAQMSETQISNHIFRTKVTETIIPKTIKIGEINNQIIGTFVRIEDAFFPTELNGLTIVDQNETFDTKRVLSVCNGSGFLNFIIENSPFANFSSVKMQSETGGTIDGIITKDFNGDNFVMVINNIEAINFKAPLCQPLDLSTFTTIFEEDFEETSGSGNLSIPEWTNFSQEGTRLFKSYTDSDTGNKATSIGAFRATEANTISWLITPKINLDNTTIELLSFESSNSFPDGSELEVLITTDWDGTETNIKTATWTTLPAIIVPDTENFMNWIPSGDIELSNFSGNAHIAFKYTGSGDPTMDGTFEIDNIKILAQ